MTLEQVNAAAKKFLVRDQRTVVITLPAAADLAGASACGVKQPCASLAKCAITGGERSCNLELGLPRLAALAAALIVGLLAPCRLSAQAPQSAGQIHAAEQNRAAEPRAGEQGNPARATSAPHGRETANGLTLVLLEDHKLPTVTFTMWIRPGSLAIRATFPASLRSPRACCAREPKSAPARRSPRKWIRSARRSTPMPRFGASYTTVNASGLINDAPHILDLMSDIVLHPASRPTNSPIQAAAASSARAASCQSRFPGAAGHFAALCMANGRCR